MDCASRLASEIILQPAATPEVARRAMCARRNSSAWTNDAGLSPAETHALSNIVRLRYHGIAVLLIDMSMGMVMNIPTTSSCSDHGDVIAVSSPNFRSADEKVRSPISVPTKRSCHDAACWNSVRWTCSTGRSGMKEGLAAVSTKARR